MTCLLVLALSSFVFAVSSETAAEFNIGVPEVGQDYVPQDYVSSPGFWDIYGSYIIWAVVILVILVILVKVKYCKKKSKKVSHKKIIKKKAKKKSKK